MPLRCDFHAHTSLDPLDLIAHSPYGYVDRAAALGFDVVCLTHHEARICPDDVIAYGRKKGVLVIPGAEATIEGAHVLLINIRPGELERVRTMADIAKVRRKDTLIIAPHPFYCWPAAALRKKLVETPGLFDAVEWSHFYNGLWNLPNVKAAKFARDTGLTLIGASDCHNLKFFGTSYSLVDAKEKTATSVIAAVKAGKVHAASRPLGLWEFVRYSFWLAWLTVRNVMPGKPVSEPHL